MTEPGDPLDPSRLRRALDIDWNAARAERVRRQTKRRLLDGREPRRHRFGVVLATGVLAAAAVVTLTITPGLGSSPSARQRAVAKNGQAASAARDRVLRYGPHFRAEVLSGAELRLADDDGAGAIVWAQRDGTVRYDIEPGRPRPHVVRTHGVEVRVVGTRFIVDASDARVRVSVERGIVEVLHDGHLSRLTQGGEATFDVSRGTIEDGLARNGSDAVVDHDSVQEALPQHAPSVRSDDRADARSGAAAPAGTRVRSLGGADERGAGTAADRATGAGVPLGPSAAGASGESDGESEGDGTLVEARLQEAERLRVAGRFDEAVALLRETVREAPTSAGRALAAFALGRVERDMGDSEAAAASFRVALRAEPDGPLAAEAELAAERASADTRPP